MFGRTARVLLLSLLLFRASLQPVEACQGFRDVSSNSVVGFFQKGAGRRGPGAGKRVGRVGTTPQFPQAQDVLFHGSACAKARMMTTKRRWRNWKAPAA